MIGKRKRFFLWHTNSFIAMLVLFLFVVVIYITGWGIHNDVYICNGQSSKTYHEFESCKGLKGCSTEIQTISMSEAKKMKRKECGYCKREKEEMDAIDASTDFNNEPNT